MTTFTVAEFANKVNRSVTAIYKNKRLKPFQTVLNGKKCLEFPDDFDYMTIMDESKVLNHVSNVSNHVLNGLKPSVETYKTVETQTANDEDMGSQLRELTSERDQLAREVELLKQRLQDKDAHISTMTETLAQLRADLEAERASHKSDRERDAVALAQAQERQHEAHVLLLQEQTKHKPFRLLLAEKAASLTNVFKKSDKKGGGDPADPEQ